MMTGSIHPQGWVPVETAWTSVGITVESCSIHPQGWVPVETAGFAAGGSTGRAVAFTPKGGCPLKLCKCGIVYRWLTRSSIHPQGWVPVETPITFMQNFRLANR